MSLRKMRNRADQELFDRPTERNRWNLERAERELEQETKTMSIVAYQYGITKHKADADKFTLRFSDVEQANKFFNNGGIAVGWAEFAVLDHAPVGEGQQGCQWVSKLTGKRSALYPWASLAEQDWEAGDVDLE